MTNMDLDNKILFQNEFERWLTAYRACLSYPFLIFLTKLKLMRLYIGYK